MALQPALEIDPARPAGIPCKGRNSERGMNEGGPSEWNWRLDRARGGDREAQERLLEPLRAKLAAFFYRRIQDADDAESLAQQTIVHAQQRLHEFRGDCPFDRWVWCIASNLVVRHYRSASQRKTTTTDFADCDSSPASFEEPSIHRTDWLNEVFLAAKLACTRIELTVMLTFYQVGSFDVVADLLELNAATVRSHFYRGRRALISYLVRYKPDMLGGESLIRAAASTMMGNSDGPELTAAEYTALVTGADPSKPYRSACLKVARRLPNPLLA